MNKLSTLVVALFAVMILAGCGEEIGRIPVNRIIPPGSPDTPEITLDLTEGDDIGIWSDMDMEYDGNVAMQFILEVIFDGETQGVMTYDPRDKNISMMESKTNINGSVNWSYSGKNTSMSVESTGAYTFRANFIANPSETLKLHQAEVVFKK